MSENSKYASYQRHIYQQGCEDVLPSMTTNPLLWESAAKEKMTPRDFDYARGGAGAGETMRYEQSPPILNNHLQPT